MWNFLLQRCLEVGCWFVVEVEVFIGIGDVDDGEGCIWVFFCLEGLFEWFMVWLVVVGEGLIYYGDMWCVGDVLSLDGVFVQEWELQYFEVVWIYCVVKEQVVGFVFWICQDFDFIVYLQQCQFDFVRDCDVVYFWVGVQVLFQVIEVEEFLFVGEVFGVERFCCQCDVMCVEVEVECGVVLQGVEKECCFYNQYERCCVLYDYCEVVCLEEVWMVGGGVFGMYQ